MNVERMKYSSQVNPTTEGSFDRLEEDMFVVNKNG